MQPPRIFPLGDSAATVEFGTEMSGPLSDAAMALAAYFEINQFPGFIEAVPAIASVTIYYDLFQAREGCSRDMTAFEFVKKLVRNALKNHTELPKLTSRIVEVPVSFGSHDGPDLHFVAESSGLAVEEVIRIFLSKDYRVYMLGFLPGFAYMGIVDERIAVPRRNSPRLAVPKGSVGIAGKQTGIYPQESPGGWQIIGNTSLDLFSPDSASPSLFNPGDTVRFVDVTAIQNRER
jgi:inhibitor of KinA